MDVGDQDQVGGLHPVNLRGLGGVNIDDLAAHRDHGGGVINGGDAHRADLGGKFLDGGGGQRRRGKQQCGGGDEVPRQAC